MIEIVHMDMFSLIYMIGIITLSLVFYFVYDRFEGKTWVQIIFGIAFLSYVAVGAVKNLLLPIIAGICLTYFVCFPIRFLFLVLIDAMQKKDMAEIQAGEDLFERLTPEEQLLWLRKNIKNSEREILKKQTLRSLSFLLIFMGFLLFAGGAAALFIAASAYTYVILGCILLFVLCFQVQPRRSNILIKFIINYAFNPDINEDIHLLENEKDCSQSKYEAIEMGNNLEIKEQVMQRLRF